MPTCFLKRVLPFVLTLMIGLMLGKFLGASVPRPTRIVTQQQTMYAIKSGALCPDTDGRVLDDSRVFAPQEVDQKARVHARPEPQYTEEARAERVEGMVVLRAVFSASGEVRHIRVISGLPYCLNWSAIEAARQIKFTPAMKDGRAVSQYIQIEYNFSLY